MLGGNTTILLSDISKLLRIYYLHYLYLKCRVNVFLIQLFELFQIIPNFIVIIAWHYLQNGIDKYSLPTHFSLFAIGIHI